MLWISSAGRCGRWSKQGAQMLLARSDSSPGRMEMTRCCRTREMAAVPVPVLLPWRDVRAQRCSGSCCWGAVSSHYSARWFGNRDPFPMCVIARPSNTQAVTASCCPEERTARHQRRGQALPEHLQILLMFSWASLSAPWWASSSAPGHTVINKEFIPPYS